MIDIWILIAIVCIAILLYKIYTTYTTYSTINNSAAMFVPIIGAGLFSGRNADNSNNSNNFDNSEDFVENTEHTEHTEHSELAEPSGILKGYEYTGSGDNNRSGMSADVVKDLKKYPRSKSEQQAITLLEGITGEKFPSVNPSWLVWKGRTLELDGYNEKLKIALEFSGPLHTKWNPQYETYQKYFNRVIRDIVKKKLCKKHKVNLIVLDIALGPQHWRNYILSRLYDFGKLDAMPLPYIDVQKFEPYHNPHLETELGLKAELKAVCKL